MGYPLGGSAESTLRASAHWHTDLFRVARRGGGPPLRFSSLDRPVLFRDEVYVPTAGERYDDEHEANLSESDTQLVGAISPRTITSADVQRGVYSGARVDHYTYDWRRGKVYQHYVWWVNKMSDDGYQWSAELSSTERFFANAIGEVYNNTCPAVLGDTKCKVVVTVTSMTVTAVADVQMEFTQGNTSFAEDWFGQGWIRWTAGNNKGVLCRVLTSTTAGAMKLSTPTRFSIRVGDTFEAGPGCNGLASTCKDKFNNLTNYRGNERGRNNKQLILSRS